MSFIFINIIAFIVTFIGCVNWGLVGIFDFNLVSAIFGAGSILATIIYILVLLSILWLVFDLFYEKGRITFCSDANRHNKHNKEI